MGKFDKLILKVQQGRSDTNINFNDLCNLLKHLGFEERIRGSHHIFRRQGIEDKPNLQEEGSKAKAYQVHQVRNMILKYNLGEDT